ncbi:MAG: hypothetical protein NPIRA06_20820 [Nitrospirales bacterium]|nr:MAG: hypothetical protein NPIRA06_20820 [Nitrospirales bacterium]
MSLFKKKKKKVEYMRWRPYKWTDKDAFLNSINPFSQKPIPDYQALGKRPDA